MFTIDSVLMYGSRICKVFDIREVMFGKDKKEYYILVPIFDTKNTIYVPKCNPNLVSKMRAPLTVSEIDQLISQVSEKEAIWFEDSKQRPLKCKEIFETGKHEEIILVIKGFMEHKRVLEAHGKNLHSTDEIMLQRAKKAIYEEFAYVLGITPDDVPEYLKTKNANF
ncbi:MAG: hypothetical protein IKK77_06470 [Clostridia bacterium]|nr:hypothetical protein [Clostridia bacterium]